MTLAENLRQQNAIMPNFDQDSPYLPAAVKLAIKNKQRATAAARNIMVKE